MVANNSWSSSGTECVSPLEWWVYKYMYMSFSSLQIIIGSIANTVVIVTIFVSRQLRQRSEDRLILNLAIANFLFLTTLLPWSMHVKIQQPNNVDQANFLDTVIGLFASMTESNTILCLTIDRFVAVVYPLRHSTIIDTRIMIVLSWGTSVLATVGYYVADIKFELDNISNIVDIIAVTYSLLFLAILMTLYAMIFYHTLKQGRNILNQRRSVGAAKEEFSSHLLLKITLRTFVLMCLFYAAYLPLAIYTIYSSSVLKDEEEDCEEEILLLEMAFFTNSCIYPFIYGLRTKRFRKEFRKKILSRCFHRTANETSVHPLSHDTFR